MKQALNRRDFLKLSSSLIFLPLLKFAAPQLTEGTRSKESLPNVILILFDALSAFNLSLYGYPRATCPNLERLARRSTVYHNHYSAGNFTTPSTASLFTSTYPWTHRAYELSGLISPKVLPNNLFNMLEGVYHRAAFTQNIFADMLLYQLEQSLDHHVRLDSFTLAGNTFYNRFFSGDAVYAMKSLDQFLFKREEAHGSLFLSILNDLGVQVRYHLASRASASVYPQGLPRLANTDLYFGFSQAMDGVMSMLDELPQPFIAYLHLMPPHEPYVPTSRFRGVFDDGWVPTEWKAHRLAPGVSQERLNERRQTYDEFIANLDDELGRLLDHLERTGLLDRSYLIMTSDHGELFEKGVHGHSTPLLMEPVIRIPLVIRAPGQFHHEDIFSTTSNVDLLPTLLHITGQPLPDWCQGQVLPGMGGHESSDRAIFVVEAKKNPAFNPLSKATTAVIKGRYKLVHYLGYKHYDDEFEFFDLESDPFELENQYNPSHPVIKELQTELKNRVSEADHPYTAR